MMVRKTQDDTQPDKVPAVSPGRFGLLLIVLVVTYLLSAFTTGQWIDALRIIFFTGAALLALRNSVVPRRRVRLILIAVLAGSAVMFAVALTTQTGNGIASLWAGLVLVLAVVLIVHRCCPSER